MYAAGLKIEVAGALVARLDELWLIGATSLLLESRNIALDSPLDTQDPGDREGCQCCGAAGVASGVTYSVTVT